MARGTAARSNARGVTARAKLLDAALHSFAARGFHGTSTRDVAEMAGMSPAAVYVHFPTKEELLFQISLNGHQDVRRVVVEAAAEATEPQDRLGEVLRRYTAWHARHHTAARVVQYEMAALAPEHTEQVAAIRRDIEKTFRSIITAGRRAGRFHVDNPRMATLALLSLGVDVSRWYRDGGSWTPEEIGDQYAVLGLRLVGA